MTLHFISYTKFWPDLEQDQQSKCQQYSFSTSNNQNLCLHRPITFMMLYLQAETEKTRRQKAGVLAH